jgi:hypothetical protein
VEKLRARGDAAVPARLRESPDLALDAVDLYLAYQEIDRDERGELLTASMLDLLERTLRVDPASAEGQRARRLWREMRSIERAFWERERKRRQQAEKEKQRNARGRRGRTDDDEE